MSLRKRCPPSCLTRPKCDHPWFYNFRVNRRRYRASTETADKQRAKDIEAKERSRILEGRHGIRRQPDITFRAFAEIYLRDHARLHKWSADRDAEIIKVLNRVFGPLILHELTAHRIEQFKRERLAGKWRGHNTTGPSKPIKPGTVNRELDALKSILSKAVEWRKLIDSPARQVKRLKVDNRRVRILSQTEQTALLAQCPRKMRSMVTLALVTGARIGEILALRWEHCQDGYLTFVETKNGRVRRIPISPAIAVLEVQPKVHPWVFTNSRTEKAYTVNGARHTFDRAVVDAGITTGDVTLHTLRHTALSRMIADGWDDYTVMSISGHSSTRMLARYTHPTEERKIGALTLGRVGTNWSQTGFGKAEQEREAEELKDLLGKVGGRREDRTPGLRIANAALSQLS